MNDDPLSQCPSCGKDGLKRLIGLGAGIIFKGSGFYETDYKRDNSEKASDTKVEKDAKTEKSTTSETDGAKSPPDT